MPEPKLSLALVFATSLFFSFCFLPRQRLQLFIKRRLVLVAAKFAGGLFEAVNLWF